MQDFDVTLKLLLQDSADEMLRQLGMPRVTQWLNVELPTVQNLRVDLLGWLENGELLHIEVQSTNSNTIQLRMAEYAIAIARIVGTYPRQLLLFVGNEPLRMKPGFRAPGMDFHYQQLDIRDLDGTALLASDRISDNILAIFAGLGDSPEDLRRILQKIVAMPRDQRDSLLPRVLLTCGLRGLQPVPQEELDVMMTIEDLMQDPLIGPGLRKKVEALHAEVSERLRAEDLAQGMAQGMSQGITQGITQGRLEEARHLSRKLLTKRFGALPAWVEARIDPLSLEELSELVTSTIDADSLTELFGEPHIH